MMRSRWELPEEPDPDGVQAAALLAYLDDSPEIELVWLDCACTPLLPHPRLEDDDGFTARCPPIKHAAFSSRSVPPPLSMRAFAAAACRRCRC